MQLEIIPNQKIEKEQLNGLYFNTPTQVKFKETDNDEEIGGIAYDDYIICGECGSTIEISDEELDYIIPLKWIDISNAIIGE